MGELPRYAPGLPLPPYAFVPGRHTHPRRRGGHMFEVPEPEPPPMDPANPWGSEAYLFGIDLFNRGFYWESHVWWEGLWHAHGRRGPIADLLKGLIRLAAAGVKAKVGRADGLRDHALAAALLLNGVAKEEGGKFAGLGLRELAAEAKKVAVEAGRLAGGGLGVVVSLAEEG